VDGSGVAGWPKGIFAITLFVEDLATAKQFDREVFGLPVAFEDDDSAVFTFGSTMVNLLKATAAPEVIEPAVVAPLDAGSRFQLTIAVDDVDAMCAELAKRGVKLLNGPMDRPWGIRTASFVDPGGHILGDRQVVLGRGRRRGAVRVGEPGQGRGADPDGGSARSRRRRSSPHLTSPVSSKPLCR
jgi:predicted enzyme related to lactoylglutathione lyase